MIDRTAILRENLAEYRKQWSDLGGKFVTDLLDEYELLLKENERLKADAACEK